MSAQRDDTVAPAAVGALRAGVRGAVLTPADDGYDIAHPVWNARAQRRPAVLVQCAGAGDVIATLRFARQLGRPLAVRAGGYSPAGLSTGDGVVADLRGLQTVHVDPLGRTAVVGGGATWAQLDAATQRYGFAVPSVPVSAMGVSGSTLGGGFGYLRRAYGLTCDNLIGADVVTAEGEHITTSGDERPELLWGLRGGGGNFGIVTRLRFRLRPLPEPLLCGPVVFPAAEAEAVLRFYRDFAHRLRDDVTTRFSLFGPAVSRVDPAMPTGAFASITVACVGHPDHAARFVEPVRHAAPALLDRLAVRPYTQLQAWPDDIYPAGRSAAVTSAFVDALDDDLVAALCERFAAMPTGSCEVRVHQMGGAVARVPRMSTAVPNRDARYLLTAMARWTHADDADAHLAWLAETEHRLRPLAVGGPHVGLCSSPVSTVEAYGAERYLRLAALKRRYDPDNVFAGNQNVAPLA